MTSFTTVIAVHALCASVVLALGPVVLFRRRRDRAHRYLGRTWAVAMLATCLTSFLIHPHGFSWLHGLSIFTLGSVSLGIVAIRRGDVPMHRGNMVGSYAGTVIAFAFAALVPERAIATTFRQDPLVILAATAAVLLVSGLWSAGVISRYGARRRRAALLGA